MENGAWIKRVSPRLTPPSLKDNTADVDRLVKGLRKDLGGKEVSVDFSLIDGVTRSLRNHDYKVYAALFQEHDCWHLIDVFSAQGGNGIYGLALDLGSSTLVLRLMDLETGRIMDETSF
ncbi:MAG: [Fe-S]-binding protein, partial [Deltaproteobacteria bacterium]|nr:[Fe-S]-binding protein [Deltaproteobacteria bacterium]